MYRFVRDNGGWAKWDMARIDTVSVDDILGARKVERQYMDSLNAVLHVYVSSRTDAEWRADDKEHVTEPHKQYYKAK